MDHVAIMKKSWGLLPKILSGEKKIESRWYKFKRSPWDKINTNDTVYFKDSGDPVLIKAKVSKFLQFLNIFPNSSINDYRGNSFSIYIIGLFRPGPYPKKSVFGISGI